MMKRLFQGKKVVIMGLGLHGGGAGAASFFYSQGADVLVTDLKSRKELRTSLDRLKGLKIRYALGKHFKKDFSNADLIIKNPAIPGSSPYLKIAQKNNIPIKSDISVFFDLCEAPIVGITGTKGKTTVTTLVHLLLKEKKPRILLAGNLGISPLDILPRVKKESIVVLELSSFGLEGLKKSPKVAVITNIYRDHLNRYEGMKEYISAKKNIFKHQSEKDFLVLNYDDAITRNFSKEARSKILFYSIEERRDCFVEEDKAFFKKQKDSILKISDLKICGEHNISNILAAVCVAKIFGVKNQKISKVLKNFSGVPHRQEFVCKKEGVKYFNDTSATMPDASIFAIRSFKERFPKSKIILIAGGENKGLDYKKMAKEINKKVKVLVLLPGSASQRIKKEVDVETISAASMDKAVRTASQVSERGDVVLLSPGAASFNLFNNEFDRGRRFIESVNRLTNG